MLEMLIASGIMVLVIAGVSSSFIATIRLSRTAMTEAELSVRMRELREKLLFHVAPPHDGKVWCGLLSADEGVEGGFKVRAVSEGFVLSSGGTASQTIQILRSDERGGFINDGDRVDDSWDHHWLTPGGIPMAPDSNAINGTAQASTMLYTINLDADLNGVRRRERIVVPIFGRAQVKSSTGKSVFHD